MPVCAYMAKKFNYLGHMGHGVFNMYLVTYMH